MKIERKHLSFLVGGLIVASGVGLAYAQSTSALSAALAEGNVGEQADGYLGVRGTVSSAVQDEIRAINIKRRSVYTQLATQRGRGITVQDVADTVGCETLATRVAQGRAYLLPDGVWRVKGAAGIALPSYCAS